MMPDIAVSVDDALTPIITVVWHDNRFGNWEIMSASSRAGNWESSGFGGEDIRITASGQGDSMFPRVTSDKDDNLRVVFHSDRGGKFDIHMASFISMSQKWSSSATGSSDLRVSKGPANALFPDIATDGAGSISVVWHDDRHSLDNPDMHEEVYLSYCPRLGHPGKHFPPLVTNIEHKLNFDFQIVSCNDSLPIELTNTEDVCLRINAPNATFWRASNEDGEQGEWNDFQATVDLDTTLVPWKLSCGNGAKQVCVQVQDQELVSFPVCKPVALVRPPDKYEVQLFSDIDMTELLPSFGPYQVAKEGEVYVKLVAPEKMPVPPGFNVIHKGLAGVFNQDTQAVEIASEDPSSTGVLEEGSDVFKGRFLVGKEDCLYHRDGLARLTINSRDACPARPASFETPEQAEDNIVVSQPPEEAPQWDPISTSPGTWAAQSASMPAASTELGLNLGPLSSPVPFTFAFEAIGQPFTLGSDFAGGAATVSVRLAARVLPEWLDIFEDRKIKVSLVSGFPAEALVGAVEILASDLPRAELDVISGLLDDPESAANLLSHEVEFTGLAAIPAGTELAVVLEDEEYSSFVSEYGANAKLFMITVGTNIPSGADPYYLRDA
jgi:hypothetical protein